MKKSSQESSREFISIGLMLFALFFGAGNLIFPVFLGQNAGWNTPWATIGFLITGVGLPFAAVLAICYSGAGIKELASRVHPVYGVLFSSLLYLTIGPFFAIPRTATVSFEIAAAPFLTDAQKTIGLYVFVFIFFLLSWWLAVTPSKLVPRIGKVITPMLLLFLFILIGSSILFPMGPWMEPFAAYSAPLKAFTNALVEGYNTMDCLAGLVFGTADPAALRAFFAANDFNALAFTDARSRYQFYNLGRLWSDMEAARAADVKLLHLCTPPVSAAEVYTAVTGKADWHNELPKPPFDYDLRSRHAALLGGSGDYLCTKQQELDDITRFMRSWRD